MAPLRTTGPTMGGSLPAGVWSTHDDNDYALEGLTVLLHREGSYDTKGFRIRLVPSLPSRLVTYTTEEGFTRFYVTKPHRVADRYPVLLCFDEQDYRRGYAWLRRPGHPLEVVTLLGTGGLQ